MTRGARGRGNISGARGRVVLDGPRGRTVAEGGRSRQVLTGPRGRVTGGGAVWAQAWRDAYAAQAAGTKQAHVAFYGDSITEGYYGDTEYWENSWVAQISDMLDTLTGVATGTGIVRCMGALPTTDTRFGFPDGSAWIGSGAGFFGANLQSVGTERLVFGPTNATEFVVSELRFFNKGLWSATVDGQAAANFNGNTGSVTRAVESIVCTTPGSHTLTLASSTLHNSFCSIEALWGGDSGVKVSRLGMGAKNIADLVGPGTPPANEADSAHWVANVDADLSVFSFGMNEPTASAPNLAAFEASLTYGVTLGLAQGSVLIVAVPPPADASSFDQYKAVMQSVATSQECGFFDFETSTGYYPGGDFHPDAAGAAAMAETLGDYIIGVL